MTLNLFNWFVNTHCLGGCVIWKTIRNNEKEFYSTMRKKLLFLILGRNCFLKRIFLIALNCFNWFVTGHIHGQNKISFIRDPKLKQISQIRFLFSSHSSWFLYAGHILRNLFTNNRRHKGKAVLCEGKSTAFRWVKYRFSHRKVPLFFLASRKPLKIRRL